MANLFAFCRNNGESEIKRVQVTQPVQEKIAGIFQQQAQTFLEGVAEEVKFGGDWKPDPDEVLVIDAPDEVEMITQAIDGNPLALASIDAANFMGEGIKALLTAVEIGGTQRILIQSFTAQQILARRFSLMLDGDTFKELTEPAFTLDNYIVAIIENGMLKFKSFAHVKRIFKLNHFYQEASDQQIDTFCAHESMKVEDIDAIKDQSDQIIRKMVFAVSKAGVLDQYNVDEIVEKANYLGLNLQVDDGKLVMPSDRKSLKQFLRFLDDGIYEAALTAKRYVTNSKRPLA